MNKIYAQPEYIKNVKFTSKCDYEHPVYRPLLGTDDKVVFKLTWYWYSGDNKEFRDALRNLNEENITKGVLKYFKYSQSALALENPELNKLFSFEFINDWKLENEKIINLDDEENMLSNQ